MTKKLCLIMLGLIFCGQLFGLLFFNLFQGALCTFFNKTFAIKCLQNYFGCLRHLFFFITPLSQNTWADGTDNINVFCILHDNGALSNKLSLGYIRIILVAKRLGLLFVILCATVNHKRAIDLFKKNNSCKIVRICCLSERNLVFHSYSYLFTDPI